MQNQQSQQTDGRHDTKTNVRVVIAHRKKYGDKNDVKNKQGNDRATMAQA